MHIRPLLAVLLALPPIASRVAAQSVPSPRDVLGFEVGADRHLADWEQIVGYLGKLAAASPAVKLDTLGPSTLGKPFVVAVVSSPENVRRLDEIRAAQRALADPRGLAPGEEARLYATQPAVVLISCNIHSSEIGSSQMAMKLAWRLATNDTLQRALRDVVVLLIPSMNPDGEQMIVDWYRRELGTQWEGGPMPWIYHPYVGHDDNRDWFMVTQRETKLVSTLLYREWFPEIVYDVHQMGHDGARLFVPPFMDPVDPNVDPLIVRGIGLIGAEMAMALQSNGKQGVLDHAIYDLWWDGGMRSTPTRHNMIGLLTEAASVKIATPIVQQPSELTGHERGLPKYERTVTFPDPWPGGEWHLRDIVDYERIASEALVSLAARRHEQYVRDFVALGRKQIALGATDSIRAYEIPIAQHDPSAVMELVHVLRAGGVELRGTDSSIVIALDQPYRAHVVDLFEVQRYPKRTLWPGGPPEPPYDMAGWTLPMQMGVRVRALRAVPTSHALPSVVGVIRDEAPRRAPRIDPANTAAFRTAFEALRAKRRVTVGSDRAGVPARTVKRLPRIALYRSWTAEIDEGWTRWLLEQYHVPFTSVTDSVVRAGALRDHADVLLVPDMSLRELRDGRSAAAVPPQYAGGLGAAGIDAIREFVRGGGTLVLLDHASELATEALGVPVRLIEVPRRLTGGREERERAVVGASEPEPLYAPGSILRVLVDARHPVAFGMPDTAAVVFTNSVTFELPSASPVHVIARYPASAGDILLSGYLQGGSAIAGQAAAVEAAVGRGRVVMFGFRAQHRAQSYGTFRMLFNALLLGRAADN